MGQTPFSLKPPPPSPLSNSNLMGNILLLLWVTPINGDEFPYLHTPQLLFLLMSTYQQVAFRGEVLTLPALQAPAPHFHGGLKQQGQQQGP